MAPSTLSSSGAKFSAAPVPEPMPEMAERTAALISVEASAFRDAAVITSLPIAPTVTVAGWLVSVVTVARFL